MNAVLYLADNGCKWRTLPHESFEEAVGDELGGVGPVFYGEIKPHEWEKLPWRQVVERTLSWLSHSRRPAKDVGIGFFLF